MIMAFRLFLFIVLLAAGFLSLMYYHNTNIPQFLLWGVGLVSLAFAFLWSRDND